MSAELFLSVVGAIIPVVQAAIAAKQHVEKPEKHRFVVRDFAELHTDAGQELFPAIYSNLRLYQEVVEPSVDEKDRVFASNVQKGISATLRKSQETAKQLYNARKNRRSKPEELQALEDKLAEYTKYLNNYQLSMMNRLLLRQLQRLGRDGDIAFVHIPEEGPENSSSTLRPDVRPIKVSYDSDPELELHISKGEVAPLETLFNSQENNAEPTSRPSLALLLACRERLPAVVKLCGDYSADPTVTGDDGLGAIHNAIGTADVLDEAPEILEVLTLLIAQGVEASVCDMTQKRLRPLHRAAMTKNASATRFLLEQDPDMVNLPDADGHTALYYACATPDQKRALIEELVNKHADFGSQPRPLMPDHEGQIIAEYLDEKGLM